MTRSITLVLAAAALALALASPAMAQSKKVAFFAASSQNGFNQATFEGVEEKAIELGYEAEIYDGKFDAIHQYSQIEDVLASGRFEGMIVAPNDPVGISGAFEQVIEAGVPIATVLFPIGPDLTTLEPQVPGITATVASPPVDGATWQAEAAAAHCADKDPCNVIIIIGFKTFPFDNLRLETFEKVLALYPNIEVVGVGEGWYSPDTSLKAMQDMLQAARDVHVVLSNADQHLVGAEIALEAEGYNVADLYLIGGGAAAISIEAIREGRLGCDPRLLPQDHGCARDGADRQRHRGHGRDQRHQHGRFGAAPGHDRQGHSRRQSRLPGRVGAITDDTRRGPRAPAASLRREVAR